MNFKSIFASLKSDSKKNPFSQLIPVFFFKGKERGEGGGFKLWEVDKRLGHGKDGYGDREREEKERDGGNKVTKEMRWVNPFSFRPFTQWSSLADWVYLYTQAKPTKKIWKFRKKKWNKWHLESCKEIFFYKFTVKSLIEAH